MKKINWGILGLASIALDEGIKAIENEPSSVFYALATNTQEEYHKAQKTLDMENFIATMRHYFRMTKWRRSISRCLMPFTKSGP